MVLLNLAAPRPAIAAARRAVVIEPDGPTRLRLNMTLRQHGFEVHAYADGLEAVDAIDELDPELVIVDAVLEGVDGFEVTRRLRAFHDGLVLMLSSMEDETAAVEGFRSGADDYIIRPWRPFELRARIDAMLRRAQLTSAATAPAASEWLEVNSLRLHPGTRRVELAGRRIDLTKSEFDLLLALFQKPDEVLAKSWIALLLRRQNGSESDHISAHDLHAIEVHVMNLRRKLGGDGRSCRWIETVRGIGYRFAPAAL